MRCMLRSRQVIRFQYDRSRLRFHQQPGPPDIKVPRQCCGRRTRSCWQTGRVEHSRRSTGKGRRRCRCAQRAAVVSHWSKAIRSLQFDLLAESLPRHETLLRPLQTLPHDHAFVAPATLRLDLGVLRPPILRLLHECSDRSSHTTRRRVRRKLTLGAGPWRTPAAHRPLNMARAARDMCDCPAFPVRGLRSSIEGETMAATNSECDWGRGALRQSCDAAVDFWRPWSCVASRAVVGQLRARCLRI
jgi:hypothetical protein